MGQKFATMLAVIASSMIVTFIPTALFSFTFGFTYGMNTATDIGVSEIGNAWDDAYALGVENGKFSAGLRHLDNPSHSTDILLIRAQLAMNGSLECVHEFDAAVEKLEQQARNTP